MILWHRLVALLFFLFFLLPSLVAQVPPKREFRGAWIATVSNLDWPTTAGADPGIQKSQLTKILDNLRNVGINAVIFQVRPECDALYSSTIDPWSYYLTGQQGLAPSPPFDPLQFACDEAHKRGMEIHAWFNPYRVERKAGSYTLAVNNVAVLHPDWVIQMGTYRFLNPGLRGVRDYVASVVADVVRRYDVDGAHFDDYFYQDGITNEDAATFASDPRGIATIGDWRRDNVNLLLKQINDSINAIKPNVKWGISPRGIWKNGTPDGTTGNDNYSTIYTDAVAWLLGKYIDYIAPQLYWPFGGNQDYAKLMPWWSGVKNGRHLYVGQAPYRITDSDWGASELPNQIRLNRTNSYAEGSILFRANYGVTNNPKGFADSLRGNLFKYPALRPIMSWKDTIPPNAPSSLTIAKISAYSASVSWLDPPVAPDGESPRQYVVYRSTSLPISFEDPRNIVSVQDQTSKYYFETPLPQPGVTYYYAATALDRLQNESRPSNIMGLNTNGVVGVEEASPIATDFRLYQNYPNPFNPTTIIAFHLPAEQRVSLRVYDLLGREIRMLADETMSAGDHYCQFDGSGLSSGVYIYRIVTSGASNGSIQGYVESRKMQLMK